MSEINTKRVLNKVVTWNPEVLIGGAPVSQQQLDALKHEAASFLDSMFWRICCETVRNQAIDEALNNSTTMDEICANKGILMCVDWMEDLVKKLKSATLKK